jgi:glutamate-1-semialdehyde 2,1-aminomutase
VVPPAEGFLEELRSHADQNGALLVFDEVITGFRVAPGGAQEAYGVLPDLTIMGKVLGGGLPAAAFGGPEVLMERVAPAGDVYQAGTLAGNPLAVAAGLATLHLLSNRAYKRLAATTAELAAGLRDAAKEAGRPVQVQEVDGLLTVFFSPEPVTDYASARASDLGAFATFVRALLDRGVYPPSSQFEAWFPSLAHREADVTFTVDAAREAFVEMADG